MTFGAPITFLVLGTLAASVPIVLHFFYRSRYKVIPWAAMKFLLTSIEQTSRRLRFQELLLLLARIAILLFLALALARPSTINTSGAGRGEAVDAVIILDNSMSMGAREGSQTRLDHGKEAALKIVDQLPRGSTVQVVRCGNHASLAGPRSPTNLEQAREIIKATELSDVATDFLPGFDEAKSALDRGSAPSKEVYLISDMQKLGWDQHQGGIKTRLNELRQQATIYMVHCSSRSPQNAAILGIEPQDNIPHTGGRNVQAVTVRNTGSERIQNIEVTLFVDGKKERGEMRPITALEPGETKSLMLTSQFDRPGPTVLTATLNADDLPGDNKFERIIEVREQVRVLVIDGSPNLEDEKKSGSYYINHALMPVPETVRSAYHIQVRVCTPNEAEPVFLADTALCILANVPMEAHPENQGITALSDEFLNRLKQFVEEGHGLMIFAGPRALPADYNVQLFEKRGLLASRWTKGWQVPLDKAEHLDPASLARNSYLMRFAERSLEGIRQVAAAQAIELEPNSNSTALISFTNGKPAVISSRIGEGEVIVVTTTADLRWTDWPIRPTFIPFMHATLNNVLSRQIRGGNTTTGQPLRLSLPPGKGPPRYMLVRSDGNEEVMNPDPGAPASKPGIKSSELLKAGQYRVEAAGTGFDPEKHPSILFAVNYDGREVENLETLNSDEIDGTLEFKPIHMKATAEGVESPSDVRSRSEWTVWILGIVLLVFVGEMFLAWMCGRAW